MQVDLAERASVRALAKAFQAAERGPDLLVRAADQDLVKPVRCQVLYILRAWWRT